MFNSCINNSLRCCPNIRTNSIPFNKRNYWVIGYNAQSLRLVRRGGIQNLSQLALQKLPVRIARQRLRQEPNVPWDFESSESRPHMLSQPGGIQHSVLFEVDRNTNLLAQSVIGYRKSNGFKHRWVGIEGSLYLRAVDVLAAAQDHVFCPINEIEEPVLVEVTDITRVQPPVYNGLGCRFGAI